MDWGGSEVLNGDRWRLVERERYGRRGLVSGEVGDREHGAQVAFVRVGEGRAAVRVVLDHELRRRCLNVGDRVGERHVGARGRRHRRDADGRDGVVGDERAGNAGAVQVGVDGFDADRVRTVGVERGVPVERVGNRRVRGDEDAVDEELDLGDTDVVVRIHRDDGGGAVVGAIGGRREGDGRDARVFRLLEGDVRDQAAASEIVDGFDGRVVGGAGGEARQEHRGSGAGHGRSGNGADGGRRCPRGFSDGARRDADFVCLGSAHRSVVAWRGPTEADLTLIGPLDGAQIGDGRRPNRIDVDEDRVRRVREDASAGIGDGVHHRIALGEDDVRNSEGADPGRDSAIGHVDEEGVEGGPRDRRRQSAEAGSESERPGGVE